MIVLSTYEDYLSDLTLETKKAYIYDIKNFLDYLKVPEKVKNSFWSDITPKIVKEYMLSLRGRSRIYNRRLASLSSFFSYLIDRDIIQYNPLAAIKRKKIKSKLPSFLKPYEFRNVYYACSKLFESKELFLCQTILLTLYYTGIRLSELRSCKSSYLDLDKKELKVMGKGEIERYVPFPSDLSSRLGILYQNKEGYLFSIDNKQLDKNWIEYHLFTRLSKKTGIHIRPHKLRHSFATNSINLGMSRECLQKILGHKQISTTDWYIHVTPRVKEEYNIAYKNLEEIKNENI